MSLQIGSISSDALGVVVEAYPSRVLPDRRQAVYEIIGRNGDFVDVYGGTYGQTFSNFIQNYDIYMNAESNGLEKKAREVAEWLYNSPSLGYAEKGYIELQDSYEPDCYREGYFVGPVDVASTLARFGRCTVSFSCKPQKFLKSGRTTVALTTGDNTLTNPTIIGGMTGWASSPIFYFQNLTGPVTLKFNGSNSSKYYLNVTETGTYRFDTANGNVSKGGVVDNSILEYVTTWDLPVLYNTVNVTPDAGVTFGAGSWIMPRWWLL